MSGRRSLSGRTEFGRVAAEGRRWSGGLVTVYGARGEPDTPARLGLAVGARGMTAVRRNRIRRRLREAFRAVDPQDGFEFVVRATPEVASVDYQLLVDNLSQGMDRVARKMRSR
jgi:ribonuclease P protein component